MIGSAKYLLKRLLPESSRRKMREHLVSMSITQLHGRKSIELSSSEAALTCVVKNGEFYLEPFIRHYSEMGFRHIFLLDNGSADQTIPIAKKYANVSVCQSNLPIETHQALFKKVMAHRSVKGGWCLDADIDEFFDYPFSDVMGLGKFLEYLNRNRYTAVVTQLLDMFSDRPLSHLATKQEKEDLKQVYRLYDISQITKVPYGESDLAKDFGQGNKISNADTVLCFGGIRKTLYGNDCLLTKHSLFVPGKGIDLFPHVHFVNYASLADVSCAMLHFKLTSNAMEIALQNKDGFVGNSKGYTDFMDLMANNPDHRIAHHTAVKLEKLNDLVTRGFLFVSDDYREYVKASAQASRFPKSSIEKSGVCVPS